MELLADWTLQHGDKARRVELYRGDLAELPAEHAVDILVVSAFRNDYWPTPTSLIGALDRKGISVQRLALAKDKDLRDEFACWLSQPLGLRSFKRLLCIESGWRGTPPEIADDLFRALAPIALTDVPTSSVAMPLIGAGDQQFPADQMLEAILHSAVGWLRRGMAVEVIKIVTYSEDSARLARQRFIEIREADRSGTDSEAWDVFLSYSRIDADGADHIHRCLTAAMPNIRIYQDKRSNEPGYNWVLSCATALDASRTVLVLFTPNYWQSGICKLEFTAAFTRQTESADTILYPIFFRDVKIPSLFRVLHYADCREADVDKLTDACNRLRQQLS